MSRFVEVNITRQTKPVSEKGFGLPLVLATSKILEYKTYTDISEVSSDFAETTEEYKLLNRMFGQNPSPSEIAVYGFKYDKTADDPTALVGVMNELIKKYNDFYYLVSVEQGDEEIEALAEWISTQKKIYAASTSGEALYKKLKGLYDNVFLLVHDQPETYPAEGLIGLLAPQTIGKYTWTFNTINGVPAVAYDNTKINEIEANNACTYITESGYNITSHGVATSGEYIDTIQGEHVIEARISQNIFGLLVRMPKIPYTSDGIGLAVAEVDKALRLSGQDGIIARENDEFLYTITIPKIEDIPANTKANRLLPDIPWEATIAGAIEKVKVNGVLKV